eukprot:COSAG05_NODE_10218_length_577_cov_1.257322_1_plen_25_part_01
MSDGGLLLCKSKSQMLIGGRSQRDS